MNFNGKTYEDRFRELYSTVAKKYNLYIKKQSIDTMVLEGHSFELIVSINFDGAFVKYKNLNDQKIYEISNFLAINTDDIDRKDIKKSDIIAKYVDNSLIIKRNVLARKFANLLDGKLDWFGRYIESQYYWEL